MKGSNNRKKGHDLERLLAKIFREFGFEFAKTSRYASKLLDDCGIDVANIPLLIQAKCGYAKNPPKYKDIYANIKAKLKENFPPEHEIHNAPIVLVHKEDGRKPEHFVWMFQHEDIVEILNDYYQLKITNIVE